MLIIITASFPVGLATPFPVEITMTINLLTKKIHGSLNRPSGVLITKTVHLDSHSGRRIGLGSSTIPHVSNSGDAKPTKSGRSGNNPDSHRSKPGKRVILKWNEDGHPVGEWGQNFTIFLGCLAKRFDYFNIAYKWNQHPFHLIESCWREIECSYVMDKNPRAWDFVFTKICRSFDAWKSDLKGKFFKRKVHDWERFWCLDPRADGIQFAAMLFYWESPEFENKKLRVDELVDLVYGKLSDNYKKNEKKAKKLEIVRLLSSSIQEAYTEFQNENNDNNTDLPRETLDRCVREAFGPDKKGRCRLKGVGAKKPIRSYSNSNPFVNEQWSSYPVEVQEKISTMQTNIQQLQSTQNELLQVLRSRKKEQEMMMEMLSRLSPESVMSG